MGYTTDFIGAFNVNPPLAGNHRQYLTKFNDTRRMKRDAAKTARRPDPIREAVGLPVGDYGAYFVGEKGFRGQDCGPDVIESNGPPRPQPGSWCQWIPNDDGTTIEWDGGEKFYEYIEWLEYIIEHFLKPWGYVLDGVVEWSGEEHGDIGRILVEKNKVTIERGHIVYR
jgi:hypothetical protein